MWRRKQKVGRMRDVPGDGSLVRRDSSDSRQTTFSIVVVELCLHSCKNPVLFDEAGAYK
jgi:hypothetical protein